MKSIAHRFRHWLFRDIVVALHEQSDRLVVQLAFNGSPDRIFSLHHRGQELLFFLPHGGSDSIQRKIILRREFYEHDILVDLHHELGNRLDNNTVIDIGANIGNHSLYFAKIANAGSVYAFEPNPYTFDILKRNIELNGAQSVVVIASAVTSSNTMLEIENSHPRNLGGTSFTPSAAGVIQGKALNDFAIAGNVALIKIDVEGMAHDVLLGSREIILKHKPWIFVEAFEQEFRSVSELLRTMDYVEHKKYRDNNYLFRPAE